MISFLIATGGSGGLSLVFFGKTIRQAKAKGITLKNNCLCRSSGRVDEQRIQLGDGRGLLALQRVHFCHSFQSLSMPFAMTSAA